MRKARPALQPYKRFGLCQNQSLQPPRFDLSLKTNRQRLEPLPNNRRGYFLSQELFLELGRLRYLKPSFGIRKKFFRKIDKFLNKPYLLFWSSSIPTLMTGPESFL